MAKNNKIQVLCSAPLYERLEKEKERVGADSMSDVGRELWEFALAIKERTANDDSRTTRELLEELLIKEYQNETTLNQIYLNTVEPNNKPEQSKVDFTKEKLKSFKQKAIERVEKYLNREE